MFQRLVSHNEDLATLVDKGYAVAFDVSNHLVIRDIPYLDADGELQWGAIVSKFDHIDQERVKPTNHEIFFAGAHPHQLDGTPISNLGGGQANVPLTGDAFKDVVIERSFSNKPKPNGEWRDFPDFFAKIESYVNIISGPAIERHAVSPLTGRSVADEIEDPIFKLRDTLTSRAEIGELAAKFEDEVVAIIGLGGTGSFVLDFLVRTRVKEIRGFDDDKFHIHNAYRAPGRTSEGEFDKPKAQVMQERYENFRHGLTLRPILIDETSANELDGVTFAFVCVDKGTARAKIFDLLIGLGIPFVDVGMGPRKKPAGLTGSIRVTQVLPQRAAEVRAQKFASEIDEPEDEYRTNIQIAELNALNAALAVMKYKQLRGFYRDDIPTDHLIFNIAEMKTYAEGIE
jgi:molybdopterin/thiamine biosynthesis adenylyltransferase